MAKRKKASRVKYPRDLYVSRVEEYDSAWLKATHDPADHVEKDESISVALYQYVGLMRVSNATTAGGEAEARRQKES